MKCSICIATKNKAVRLRKVLESIYRQSINFDFEVIVTDDGSEDDTPELLHEYFEHENFSFIRLENPKYRNPSVPRNAAYRKAKGEIIIAQSDDVVHVSNAIPQLCTRLENGTFVIAQVVNVFMDSLEFVPGFNPYTGLKNPRPFFFLGAVWRKDLYAVGGNDEEFVKPGFDDDWFADCLIRGLSLKAIFDDGILGFHLHHDRPANLSSLVMDSLELYRTKNSEAAEGKIKWEASGGPWEYDP